MKYYFTASTKRIKEDGKKYGFIIKLLDRLGHKGLNYVHFAPEDPLKKKYLESVKKDRIKTYGLQTSLIEKADILIADVTRESVTVGYQIDYALRRKIPVLVVSGSNPEKSISVMLFHDHYGLLTVREYKNIKDLEQILTDYMREVVSEKIKFNFFINIKINNFLTKKSNTEGKSKSEIIRGILLREIEKEKEKI